MKTLVRADEKGRLCIRGARNGRKYLVTAEKEGFWITPAAPVRPSKRRREWAGSKSSLAEHLERLAEKGLRIEPAPNARAKVGKSRF